VDESGGYANGALQLGKLALTLTLSRPTGEGTAIG